MKFFYGSIRKKLVVLVLLATMPTFLILLGTELRNRREAISLAEKDAALFLSGFAELQRRVMDSTQTLLRTVASMPEISQLKEDQSRIVLETLLKTNPIYTNAILVDLKGDVVAAGRNHEKTKGMNFADRKQFKEALVSKGFASGEFVVGKSSHKPIFPFGMAVIDPRGEVTGAIIIGVSLAHYGEIFARGEYPENSFLGLCDHDGIRLCRYPENDKTSIGKPIKRTVYQAAASGQRGSVSAETSDGKKRIIAFEPLRLDAQTPPYMYMFMGIDQELLLKNAQGILLRLIFVSLLSLVLALFIAWYVGGKNIAHSIERLSLATKRFGRGEENVVSGIEYQDGEIGDLAESFDSMVKIIHQREEEKSKLVFQLNQSQKMEAIGQLAGGIAHDFNNMLGGILGAAELLKPHLPENPKAEKKLQMIIQSATRAAELTRNLLTFARTDNKISTTVNIHNIITETLSILKNTIDRRIKVETDLQAEATSIVGDLAQLQSAILNLGINAAQAMPEGGALSIRTGTIDIDESFCASSAFELKPGDYLELEISDTGSGIPAEIKDKIFEPFFSSKKLGEGTGLGLAAVYGTVKQHAGAITVHSELNLGTTFQLLFPLSKGQANPAEPAVEPISGTGTVLLVDDEEVMRVTGKAILKKLGYRVLLAENGEHALEVFKEKKQEIDLVILDMIMPLMNGKDCFFALQKLNPQLRAIISSGYSRKGDIKELVEGGLKGFIRKPYLSVSLSQAVHNALQI